MSNSREPTCSLSRALVAALCDECWYLHTCCRRRWYHLPARMSLGHRILFSNNWCANASTAEYLCTTCCTRCSEMSWLCPFTPLLHFHDLLVDSCRQHFSTSLRSRRDSASACHPEPTWQRPLHRPTSAGAPVDSPLGVILSVNRDLFFSLPWTTEMSPFFPKEASAASKWLVPCTGRLWWVGQRRPWFFFWGTW